MGTYKNLPPKKVDKDKLLQKIPSMKENEVYAPNYKNGEQVALIRYPHAGTFEIPILTVT